MTARLSRRDRVPAPCEDLAAFVAGRVAAASDTGLDADLNFAIYDAQCFNLNPATNVMNPRAEAALSRGLGSRPSPGYPGDKYETGLEAIEVIAAELAAEVFGASHAEIRVGSGASANLYGFMALVMPTAARGFTAL